MLTTSSVFHKLITTMANQNKNNNWHKWIVLYTKMLWSNKIMCKHWVLSYRLTQTPWSNQKSLTAVDFVHIQTIKSTQIISFFNPSVLKVVLSHLMLRIYIFEFYLNLNSTFWLLNVSLEITANCVIWQIFKVTEILTNHIWSRDKTNSIIFLRIMPLTNQNIQIRLFRSLRIMKNKITVYEHCFEFGFVCVSEMFFNLVVFVCACVLCRKCGMWMYVCMYFAFVNERARRQNNDMSINTVGESTWNGNKKSGEDEILFYSLLTFCFRLRFYILIFVLSSLFMIFRHRSRLPLLSHSQFNSLFTQNLWFVLYDRMQFHLFGKQIAVDMNSSLYVVFLYDNLSHLNECESHLLCRSQP